MSNNNTPKNANAITILMADDDDDDYLLTKKALSQSDLSTHLIRVSNGEELINYLKGKGEIGKNAIRPSMILLDLNMPRKDGREALKEIKADISIRDIPVVIFTTSKAEEDIYRTYQLGSNSFITKPVTFDDLVRVMQSLGVYWFETVQLPGSHAN